MKIKKHKKWQNQQNEKVENQKCDQNSPSDPPMWFSALKPGPVVPPGIEKTPDQAARISQSVDFGQLSDILAILGGYQFLTLFSSFFMISILSLFVFLHFLHFRVLMILSLFVFSPFCPFFTIRPYCNVMWSFLTHFLVHRGRTELLCGGSPLITEEWFF